MQCEHDEDRSKKIQKIVASPADYSDESGGTQKRSEPFPKTKTQAEPRNTPDYGVGEKRRYEQGIKTNDRPGTLHQRMQQYSG